MNVHTLDAIIWVSMEDYSDSDTSLESEYESDQGFTPWFDSEGDELNENLEHELSELVYHSEEYNNAAWNLQAQLQAQCLAQLHTKIKARAQLPDPN